MPLRGETRLSASHQGQVELRPYRDEFRLREKITLRAQYPNDFRSCHYPKHGREVLIPTLRVSGAKRAPHLPRQGGASEGLVNRFWVTSEQIWY